MHESLQIVFFICIPLLLLLVVALVVRWLRRPRTEVTFPNFSLAIHGVGLSGGFVTYTTNSWQTAFDMSLGRGKGRGIISVQVPSDLGPEKTRDIVTNLALGLAKLGYEYRVFRKREPRQVSSEEQAIAVEQLQKMGFDPTKLVEQGSVTRLTAPRALSIPPADLQLVLPKIAKLASYAKGIEERIEILASSTEIEDFSQ